MKSDNGPDQPSFAGCRHYACQVDEGSKGQRLDQFLSRQRELFDQGLSRSVLQNLIRDRYVLVDRNPVKAGHRLKPGARVAVYVPPPQPSALVPQEIDFTILHEDSDLVVISKPPGLVVHPANGNEEGTLVHGLLYHCHDFAGVGGEMRPGIVHRLDKDTSGLMVIAKNDQAHHSLVDQFKAKTVRKTYHAITDGRFSEETGRFVSHIGRHPVNRKKMAVVQRGGKEAVTNWQIVAHYRDFFSLVEIGLETGRTHQIRVHMAANGTPVAGDPVYGRKNRLYAALGIVRQCLHASRLTFQHPGSGERLTFEAPLWPDMAQVIEKLAAEKG